MTGRPGVRQGRDHRARVFANGAQQIAPKGAVVAAQVIGCGCCGCQECGGLSVVVQGRVLRGGQFFRHSAEKRLPLLRAAAQLLAQGCRQVGQSAGHVALFGLLQGAVQSAYAAGQAADKIGQVGVGGADLAQGADEDFSLPRRLFDLFELFLGFQVNVREVIQHCARALLYQAGQKVVDGGGGVGKDRDERLPKFGLDRLQVGGQKPLRIGKAVRRAREVALCVRCGLHEVLVTEHHHLALGHLVKGFGDALFKGEGLQIGLGHIDAELLERFSFAGNAAADLLEGRIEVQVVERRHVSGEACKAFGHFHDLISRQAG